MQVNSTFMGVCVFRFANKKEIAKMNADGDGRAQEAMRKDLNDLRSKSVWDVDSVQEWHRVVRHVRAAGQRFHFGQGFRDHCREGVRFSKRGRNDKDGI